MGIYVYHPRNAGRIVAREVGRHLNKSWVGATYKLPSVSEDVDLLAQLPSLDVIFNTPTLLSAHHVLISDDPIKVVVCTLQCATTIT